MCGCVICDGKVKVRELPPHGEYKIVTHQAKP
ncbi:XtrA/YqaO family protein [Domibacillus indicus]